MSLLCVEDEAWENVANFIIKHDSLEKLYVNTQTHDPRIPVHLKNCIFPELESGYIHHLCSLSLVWSTIVSGSRLGYGVVRASPGMLARIEKVTFLEQLCHELICSLNEEYNWRVDHPKLHTFFQWLKRLSRLALFGDTYATDRDTYPEDYYFD